MTAKSSRSRLSLLVLAAFAVLVFLEACPTGTPPGVPTGLKAQNPTATTVDLAWQAVADATGYKVYRSVASAAFSMVKDNVTATKFTDTNLTPATAYAYKVSSFNASGESELSAAVTVTTLSGSNPTGATAAVSAGLALLMQGPPDFDQALTQFALAAQLDPTNGQAVLFMTALTLMSTVVNADVQTLATKYLGISGYPATINALFTPGQYGVPAWISYPVTSTGYTYVTTGGDYHFDGLTYVPVPPGTGEYSYGPMTSYFPQIGIPSDIRLWEDSNPAITTPNEYMLGILYNLITNNPSGFNDLADHVVDNILGKALDQAISSLQGVSDTAQIDFTSDMFPGLGWPEDIHGQPIKISIGKAELLSLSAFLEMIKASAYMGKAIDLSLPLQQYWTVLNPVDHTFNDTAAILSVVYTLPTPFASGFLRARSDAVASLGKAKTAYVDALTSMSTAFDLVLARTGSTFALSASSPIADIQANWVTATNVMHFGKIVVGKMLASIQNGTPMIIPTDPAELSNPTTFFANYSTIGAWPTSADDGLSASNGGPAAVAVNLAPAFASPLSALDSIIDMNPATGEPVWYRFSATYDMVNDNRQMTGATITDAPVSSLSNGTATNESVGTGYSAALPTTLPVYAIKLKDLTFGGSVVVSSTLLQNIKTALLSNGGLSTNLAPGALDNLLVQSTSGGPISGYLPFFPAFIAYNSFVARDTTLTVDPDGIPANGDQFTYTTTGSFWWAFATMTATNTPYVVGSF